MPVESMGASASHGAGAAGGAGGGDDGHVSLTGMHDPDAQQK